MKISLGLLITCLVTHLGFAQFSLLKDINISQNPNDNSDPQDFAIFHDSLFFVAYSDGVLSHIVKTDGSTFGTSVIVSQNYSSPKNLISACGKLFFNGYDMLYGNELFVYDGQSAPVRLTDINQGSGNSIIHYIGEVAGYLYFKASSSNGYLFYRTDGVQVELIQNFHPTFYTLGVGINWNNKLYYVGIDNSVANGNYLIASDTATTSVFQLANETIHKFFNLGSKFLFYTNLNNVYVSDGTTAGTQTIVNAGDFIYMDHFVLVDTLVYFVGKTASAGMNLWRTDGTVAGTVMLGDLNPGTADFLIDKVFELNNEVFLIGNFPGNGSTRKLFKHIAPLSIQLISNLTVVSTSNFIDTVFVKNNNEMYFTAYDPAVPEGYQLWKTNGTGSGTMKVNHIGPNIYGPEIKHTISYHNKIYFNARDNNSGNELWVSDGTLNGTYMYYNLNGQSPSSPRHFTVSNNQLYFIASTNNSVDDLYVSDGTTAGTQLVKSLSGIGFPPAYDMAAINNLVVFGKSGPSGAKDAYVSNGTTLGTYTLGDLSAAFVQPIGFTELNGYLYFVGGLPNNASAIFRTDGTPIGTTQIATNVIDFNATAFTDEPFFVKSGNSLFFNGKDDELWRIDGSTGQPLLVKDIYPGLADASNPKKLFSFNNKIYFQANDGVSGAELWVSDGTALGTNIIADLNPGPGSSEIYQINNFDSAIFIACAENTTHGTLYKHTPLSGITEVVYHWQNAYPKKLLHVGNKLLIELYDLTEGTVLWTTQGDSITTVFMKNTKPTIFGEEPDVFLESNGYVYFSQKDENNQDQVWRSDGTSCGTHKISNYNEISGNYILDMVDFNGDIYMDASSNGSSQEVWRYTFASPIFDTISQVLCANSTINWNGLVIQDTGQYCFSSLNSAGIDSTIVLILTSDTSNIALSTFSFPSNVNTCDGIIAVQLSGNNPIQLDFNGLTTTVNGSYAMLDNLCPGIHELIVEDSCGSVIIETYIVPVDTNFIFNNPYLDSTALDSLGITNTNCLIDYFSIDTAFISSIWSTGNTIHVVWNIIDSNGTNLDTTTYNLMSGSGVYWIQLNIFCPIKAIGSYFTVTEAIYFDEEMGVLNAELHEPGLSVKLFPNPTQQTLFIQSDQSIQKYRIVDLSGKVFKEDTLHPNHQIEVTELDSGFYFLTLISNEAQITLTFQKTN